MANTFSQLTIHCIFAVKGRENLILDSFRNELHQYLYGILENIKVYPFAIGGWKDHIHILFEMQPSSNISNIVMIVKASSSKWINENNFLRGKFQWQEGFGAFSISKSHRDRVIKYIMQQEQHHKKMHFKDEYMDLLKLHEIPLREQYNFIFY